VVFHRLQLYIINVKIIMYLWESVMHRVNLREWSDALTHSETFMKECSHQILSLMAFVFHILESLARYRLGGIRIILETAIGFLLMQLIFLQSKAVSIKMLSVYLIWKIILNWKNSMSATFFNRFIKEIKILEL